MVLFNYYMKHKPNNRHSIEMKCCIKHVGNVAFGMHDKWKQACEINYAIVWNINDVSPKFSLHFACACLIYLFILYHLEVTRLLNFASNDYLQYLLTVYVHWLVSWYIYILKILATVAKAALFYMPSIV